MTVTLQSLFDRMKVGELVASDREDAIRCLAKLACADLPEVSIEQIVEAVVLREATCQTIVAEGLAIPHITTEFPEEYRIVLGRSREGIDYGVPESGRVHLVALLIVSRNRGAAHLDLLAALAELLNSEDFRRELIQSPHTDSIWRLLRTKIRPSDSTGTMQPIAPALSLILARQAMELCDAVGGQALLFAVDRAESVPWTALRHWKGRVLLVLTEKNDDRLMDRRDVHAFEVPHTTLTRVDRANLGLLLAAASELVTSKSSIICLTGPGGPTLDSLTVMRPASDFDAIFGGHATRHSAKIRPAVILRVLTLAIQLAAEGREAKRVGAMFVVGDSRNVIRHSRQLVLNPFHGYSRDLRNILDPSLTETIKEFAFLDGAFVVEPNGVVLSAGTYLTGDATRIMLPQGLGARHHAAAAISAATKCLAITLSQSTGTVTAFRNGKIVLTLEHATPTPT